MIRPILIANDIYKLMKDASVYGNVLVKDRDKLCTICLTDWLFDNFDNFISDSQSLTLKSCINYLARDGRYSNNLHNDIV